MAHYFTPDESEREELAAQVRYERRTAWRRALHPRDPDYYGDPEDFPGYEPDEVDQ